MKIKFERRWSNDIAFEVEIGDEFKERSLRDQRGEAIKKALGSDSNLSGSDPSGSDLSGVPAIPNIHQAIYAVASAPGCLEMGSWHKCETTHCRAGWVVTLAGEAGKDMEWCIGTPAAAALIYLKSDPKIERIPNFYAGNEEALADMKRLAEAEAARAA